MHNPEKYNKHHVVQAKLNYEYLQEYELNASWRTHCDSVIDIGSGDGDFTSNTLVKMLPENFKEVVGCDKNEAMVQFAKKNYSRDRVTFEKLDITKELPKQYYNRFNQAFSFFTFQLIQNQKEAFSNIYNLLAPDGGCFIVFVGGCEMYEIFRLISKVPKWKQWTSHVEDIIAPYHDCSDPEAEIKQIMTEIGFTDISVTCKKTKHCYKSPEEFKISVLGNIEAFNLLGLPDSISDEFYTDFLKMSQENGCLDENNILDFTMIVVQAKK